MIKEATDKQHEKISKEGEREKKQLVNDTRKKDE